VPIPGMFFLYLLYYDCDFWGFFMFSFGALAQGCGDSAVGIEGWQHERFRLVSN
jgi:hypothetical protein